MTFNFEKYWAEHGIHTNPEIMGLAFKECAKMAVDAVLQSIEEAPSADLPCPTCYRMATTKAFQLTFPMGALKFCPSCGTKQPDRGR